MYVSGLKGSAGEAEPAGANLDRIDKQCGLVYN